MLIYKAKKISPNSYKNIKKIIKIKKSPRKRFTSEDIEKLSCLKGLGHSWEYIYSEFSEFSHGALRNKWTKLCKENEQEDDKIIEPINKAKKKTRQWTKIEDEKLLSLFNKNLSWQDISNQIPDRNLNSCKLRKYYLDKKESQSSSLTDFSAEDPLYYLNE